MFEILTSISRDYLDVISFLIAILSLVPSVVILGSAMRNLKKSSKKSDDIYKTVKEFEQRKSIEVINNSLIEIPKGLSKEEYFDKLKSILSEVSFNQLKNSENSEQNSIIEDLIQNHHEQALLQASVQFWFSLIASVVGFIFITTMILLANSSQWYEYIFKVLPGVIIETVSLLFFKQSSATRERASDFLNRLRNDSQITKSIVIADSIEDDELKSSVKAQIALHICGIKEYQDITINRRDKKQE